MTEILNAQRPRGKTFRDYPGLPRALVRSMLSDLNRGPTPTEWKRELQAHRDAHKREAQARTEMLLSLASKSAAA